MENQENDILCLLVEREDLATVKSALIEEGIEFGLLNGNPLVIVLSKEGNTKMISQEHVREYDKPIQPSKVTSCFFWPEWWRKC